MSARINYPPHIARSGSDLVGPVVRFRGQPVAMTSSPPRDTGDPRYDRCTEHHLACDCREAEQNEQITENRLNRAQMRDQFDVALADHPTLVILDGQPRADLQCQCDGCRFARAVDLVPYKNFRYVGSRT